MIVIQIETIQLHMMKTFDAYWNCIQYQMTHLFLKYVFSKLRKAEYLITSRQMPRVRVLTQAGDAVWAASRHQIRH